MIKTYKYLLQPNKTQQKALTDLLWQQKCVYNSALEERIKAWRECSSSVSYLDQQSQIKYYSTDQKKYGFSVCKGTITRLDLSFQSFYRRCKAGETPGYPRFKSYKRFDTVSYPEKYGWKHEYQDKLYLQGIGDVKLKYTRARYGVPKCCQVKREGKRWFVCIQCEVLAKPLPKTGRTVGFDLGVTNLLTSWDGEGSTKHENLRSGKKAAHALASLQQELAKKKDKRSKRRKRCVQRLAKASRKVANQRKDHNHKLSRELVNNNDTLVFEKLTIPQMVEKKGQRKLNNSIHDASWGQLLRYVNYKAEDAGRELILVNPKYTSQRCNSCGYISRDNRLSQANFACKQCGHKDNADVNAAKNIRWLGLNQNVILQKEVA